MLKKEDSGKFLSKKAYEVSYALWRVASRVKSENFKDAIEDAALGLLESSAVENFSKMQSSSSGIEYLLRFGADVGVIHPENSEVIIAELQNNINPAIAELYNSAKKEAVSLDGIFSENYLPDNENLVDDEIVINESDPEEGRGEFFERTTDNGNGNGVAKSAIRQSAILERIRQNGNCRIKEIQEILPDASERTLRYDLQNLLSQGLIERVGSGGPATHYKAK